MAFSSSRKQTGRSASRRAVISDINITPFVDVLLVLLIIFMVSAPMMTSSVDVNLPQGTDSNPIKLQPITISIKEDGSIYLQDNLIKISILGAKLKDITANDLKQKILVRADKKLDYGTVMHVVKTIGQAGFSHVVLATEIIK